MSNADMTKDWALNAEVHTQMCMCTYTPRTH